MRSQQHYTKHKRNIESGLRFVYNIAEITEYAIKSTYLFVL